MFFKTFLQRGWILPSLTGILTALLMLPLTVTAGAPSEINVKASMGPYQLYIREGTLGDHYQLSRSVDVPFINSMGIRHTQLESRLLRGEENRFIIDSVPLLSFPVRDLGHMKVTSRLEYRAFNYSFLPLQLIGKEDSKREWRIRAIFAYDTPTFHYKNLAVQGWATVSPRFSTKSDADSRNQAGLRISHSDLPFTISPFIDTVRNDSLHHSYSLVGVYVSLPL